jgi:uncharacterized NAD-dependent epimerase/dehydratase family protein
VHGRTMKYFETEGPAFPVLSPAEEGRLVEAFLAPVWPARVAAVALAAPGLDAADHRAMSEAIAKDTGVPVHDVVRHGGRALLEAVLAELGRRRTPRQAPMPIARRTA